MRRLVFGIGVLLACSQSPTDPDSIVRVELDGSRFTVDESIAMTIINTSTHDVFFDHCDYRIPLVIERRQDDAWDAVHYYNGPACPAIYLSGVLTLQPDQAQSWQIHGHGPGEYRVGVTFGNRSGRMDKVVYSPSYRIE